MSNVVQLMAILDRKKRIVFFLSEVSHFSRTCMGEHDEYLLKIIDFYKIITCCRFLINTLANYIKNKASPALVKNESSIWI